VGLAFAFEGRTFGAVMAKLAVDRFLAYVRRSGLVESDRLTQAIGQWKSQASAQELDDAARCGEFLVRSGLITPWQCHKLLEGRHRGFTLGNYRLLDHLGSGGMSNVYLAEHLLMQRLVAIKVLPEHRVADAEYLARFRYEGQAVAALDHPNIVRAYDLGSEGRIHYLVMEYVDGHDLEEMVDRVGPLGFQTAARYIAQAAAGLKHAHESGMVHRDIKPANLLVDRRGTVKVLDLGLAKFKAEVRPVPEFARNEQVLGTAEYFAPEQAVNSSTVDQRADIYGLGCTLYYLLTGRPPFAGRTALELMHAHHRQQATSILIDRPDAPAPLIEICRRMMEKSPEARYQNCGEVASALESWLAAERAAGRGSGDSSNPLAAMERAALRDTDTNLQETARIEKAADPSAASSDVLSPYRLSYRLSSYRLSSHSNRRAEATSGRASDVLSTPPPAPEPPLVSPPRTAPEPPPVSALPIAERARDATPASFSIVAPSGTRSARSKATSRATSGAREAAWIWTLAIASIALLALVVALLAARG